jgi:hypothetical protein
MSIGTNLAPVNLMVRAMRFCSIRIIFTRATSFRIVRTADNFSAEALDPIYPSNSKSFLFNFPSSSSRPARFFVFSSDGFQCESAKVQLFRQGPFLFPSE